MWLLYRDTLAQAIIQIWLAINLGLPGAAPAERRDAEVGDRPLEFRCDAMQILTKPNRAVCQGNVVLRRDDLLVCCRYFEGHADTAWGWQRFVCTQEVRARRGDETMWADKAEFDVATSALTLSGQPQLQRGQSLLSGQRIIVDVKQDRARVIKPTGVIHQATGERPAPAPDPIAGALPATCPLPPPAEPRR